MPFAKFLREIAVVSALSAAPVIPAAAQPTSPSINERASGAIAPVHDPVIIREGDTYHVFSTGIGPDGQGLISHRTSPDLIQWELAPPPFTSLPEWVVGAVPGVRNLWAPDISYVNGRYRLYYSASTFGSNRSAIGVATSATLDPASPDYGWRDEGMVVTSNPADDFNAIDPAFLADGDGRHWLSLGSFWSGLKLFELNPQTGKLLDPAAGPVTIASRPVPAGAPSIVEAPYIFERDGSYWLLASYDYCCKGVNSTYYTVVGRAEDVTGPYLGKDGSSMLEGGGTILLRADLQEQERFRGPGHPGHFRDADSTDYVVYHAYDKDRNGVPTLRILPLSWGADGWPVPAE
ncbi:arabinan endo-1,5-alpha-L-arabinosidase [Sphingosinithalassobacter sp. LHW66-3]|uniref:arabinan endo-1,5-alpha-L-arabinosidase n=1 Tax=Sphingosinithalassobacter sp. LHW66-3 TaxID=3424718 RepID=UPI003D6B6CEC